MSNFNNFIRKFTPVGWYTQLVEKLLGRALPVDGVVDNLIGAYTGTRMTNKAKEEIDYQNESNYQYWLKTESLPAQVTQYKDAGLNPMLIAGGGPSVSASSAGSGSSSDPNPLSAISSLLGPLFQMQMTKMRLDTESKLRNREMDIESERNKNQAELWLTLQRRNTAEAVRTELDNSIFGIRKESLEKDVALKSANINQIMQLTQESITRMYVNREHVALMKSQIRETDQRALAESFQAAIFEAQSRYADSYFKSLDQIAGATAYISTLDKEAAEKYKSTYLDAYYARLAGVIIQAGKDAKIFQSPFFEKFLEGKMTDKERAEFFGSFVRSIVPALLAAGGLIGSAAIKAGSAANGLYVPSYLGPTFGPPSYSPPSL